jgi:LCP family protein required for cell wall assembly
VPRPRHLSVFEAALRHSHLGTQYSLGDIGLGSNARRTYSSTRRNQRLLSAGLLLAFAVVAAILGLFAFEFVRDFIVAANILPDLRVDPDDTDVSYRPGEPLPVWTGTDRVTVLLMGIDQRPDEQGPTRTDTMLLLTIDPVVKTAAVLSIPRDLWVPIPMGQNSLHDRINHAHVYGELYDWPGGGPALAIDTVEYNLGVHVNYYVVVDFRAFEHVVDLIDGVDVYVQEEIWDPDFPDDDGGYEPLYIPAGWQHFDGEMALKYARTRAGGTDYDRIRQQQNVLQAVFDRVTRPDMLRSLASAAPELWEALQGSVSVSPDLSLAKIIALARLASEVDPANLGFHAIDQEYTVSYTTPDGKMVELPQRERVRELVDHVFSAGPVPVGEDAQSQLEMEAARVEVLNGTLVSGLATDTGETLRQGGVDVVHVGNADRSNYAESLVKVYGSKAFTADYVAELLELQPTAVVPVGGSGGEYDIVVVLGADYGQAAQ